MDLMILKLDLFELLKNPFILLFLTIFLGNIFGKITIKKISLGSSGCLFVGIFISYLLGTYMSYRELDINGSFIPSTLFTFSLILFISAVGLKASKKIKEVLKDYGLKFILLGFAITTSGALSTFLFIKILASDIGESIIGTFSGALTSSPGLASAIESAEELGKSEELVGLGYSVAYIFGVVIVILFVQLLTKYYKKRDLLKPSSVKINENKSINLHKVDFDILAYSIVCILGILLGNINIYLGSTIGFFSLGTTGGVLISGLLLGYKKSIFKLNFHMDDKILNVIRDLGLNMFLAIVGINYGYEAILGIYNHGFVLLIAGSLTALISISVGFIVGSLLKIKPIYLIGGLCGGMTSTPGLATAIEATESDDVSISYGATYPFALFFMILYTNILFKFI